MTTHATAYRQNQQGNTNPLTFAIGVGFFSGLIWGAVHWLFYVLHFTKVIPGFLGEPFLKHSYLISGRGQFAGWLLFIAFSIIASLIYVLLLRKLKGPWPGIVYGLVWWCIIFAMAGPQLHMFKQLNQIGWNTIVSEFCLFLLWGLFIGYTTAVEFTDERKREPEEV